LAAELRQKVGHVCGIDVDEPSIMLARSRSEPDVEFLLADFFAQPFEPESFDAVVSVATLHHMDAAAALRRMAELLRPGGTLAAVGLARPDLPRDLGRELFAVLVNRLYMWTRTYREHSAPKVWPPPHTYSEVRQIAESVLPGVRYRRHLLWRYSLAWTKPTHEKALSSRS
jgi:SAM-dependent methyltransferase